MDDKNPQKMTDHHEISLNTKQNKTPLMRNSWGGTTLTLKRCKILELLGKNIKSVSISYLKTYPRLSTFEKEPNITHRNEKSKN